MLPERDQGFGLSYWTGHRLQRVIDPEVNKGYMTYSVINLSI